MSAAAYVFARGRWTQSQAEKWMADRNLVYLLLLATDEILEFNMSEPAEGVPYGLCAVPGYVGVYEYARKNMNG